MMKYTDTEMDLMHYKAEAESWRRNFEELKVKYEELQNLFVEVDDELLYYKEKFINESIQKDILRSDIEEIKYRLSEVESKISNTNA